MAWRGSYKYLILLVVWMIFGYVHYAMRKQKDAATVASAGVDVDVDVNVNVGNSEPHFPTPTPLPKLAIPELPTPIFYMPLRTCIDRKGFAVGDFTVEVLPSDILAYSTEMLLRRNWVKLMGAKEGPYFQDLLVKLSEVHFDHVAASQSFRDKLSIQCDEVSLKPLESGDQPIPLHVPLFWTEYNPKHLGSAQRNVLTRNFTYDWFDPSSIYLDVQQPSAMSKQIAGGGSRSYTISFWMKWINMKLEKGIPARLRILSAGSIPEHIAPNSSFAIGTFQKPNARGLLYVSAYIMLGDELYICQANTDSFSNEHLYHVSVSFGYDMKGRFTVPEGSDFEVHLYVNGMIEAVSNQPVPLDEPLPAVMQSLKSIDSSAYDPESLRQDGFLSVGGMDRDVCLRLRRRLAQVKSTIGTVSSAATVHACLPHLGYVFGVRVYHEAVPVVAIWSQYEKDCAETRNGECVTRDVVLALEPFYFSRSSEFISPSLYWHGQRYPDKLPGDAPALLQKRFPAVRRFTTVTDVTNETVVYANEDVKFGIMQHDAQNVPLLVESDSVYRVRFEGPTIFRGTVTSDEGDPAHLLIHAKFALPGVYQMYVLKQDMGECSAYGIEENDMSTAYDTYCGSRKSSLPGVPVTIKVLPARRADASYEKLLAYLQASTPSKLPVCTHLHSPGFWVPARVNDDNELEVHVPKISSAEDVRAGISDGIPQGPGGEWLARWQPWTCRYISFSKARIDRCSAAAHIRKQYGLPEVKDVTETFQTPVHLRPWLATAGDSTTNYMFREYYQRLEIGDTEYFAKTDCAAKKHDRIAAFDSGISLPAVFSGGDTLSRLGSAEGIVNALLRPPELSLRALEESVRSVHENASDSEVENTLNQRKGPLFFLVNFGLHDIRSVEDRRKLVVTSTMRLLDEVRRRWPGVLIIFRDFYQLQYNFCLRNAYNQRTLRKMWMKLVRAYNLEWINSYEMSDPRCDASVDAVHYDSCASRQGKYALTGSMSKQIMDMALTRVCGDV